MGRASAVTVFFALAVSTLILRLAYGAQLALGAARLRSAFWLTGRNLSWAWSSFWVLRRFGSA
jgi:hypothetical protein